MPSSEQKESASTASAAAAAASIAAADAKMEVRNEFGETPLLRAARKGETQQALQLIARGADVNVTDYSNNTVIYYAVLAVSATKYPKVDRKLNKQLIIALCQSRKLTPETLLRIPSGNTYSILAQYMGFYDNGGVTDVEPDFEIVNALLNAGAVVDNNVLGFMLPNEVFEENFVRLAADLLNFVIRGRVIVNPENFHRIVHVLAATANLDDMIMKFSKEIASSQITDRLAKAAQCVDINWTDGSDTYFSLAKKNNNIILLQALMTSRQPISAATIKSLNKDEELQPGDEKRQLKVVSHINAEISPKAKFYGANKAIQRLLKFNLSIQCLTPKVLAHHLILAMEYTTGNPDFQKYVDMQLEKIMRCRVYGMLLVLDHDKKLALHHAAKAKLSNTLRGLLSVAPWTQMRARDNDETVAEEYCNRDAKCVAVFREFQGQADFIDIWNFVKNKKDDSIEWNAFSEIIAVLAAPKNTANALGYIADKIKNLKQLNFIQRPSEFIAILQAILKFVGIEDYLKMAITPSLLEKMQNSFNIFAHYVRNVTNLSLEESGKLKKLLAVIDGNPKSTAIYAHASAAAAAPAHAAASDGKASASPLLAALDASAAAARVMSGSRTVAVGSGVAAVAAQLPLPPAPAMLTAGPK